MPKKKFGKKAVKKAPIGSHRSLKHDLETLCMKYGIEHVKEELHRLESSLNGEDHGWPDDDDEYSA